MSTCFTSEGLASSVVGSLSEYGRLCLCPSLVGFLSECGWLYPHSVAWFLCSVVTRGHDADCWWFIHSVVGRYFPGCFSVALVSLFRCLAYVDAVPTYHLTRGALYQVALSFSGFVLDCSGHPLFGVGVWGAWEQPPRGALWVSDLVGHIVQTWPDSECSHTVQFLDCSDLNYHLFWHGMTLLVLMCRKTLISLALYMSSNLTHTSIYLIYPSDQLGNKSHVASGFLWCASFMIMWLSQSSVAL